MRSAARLSRWASRHASFDVPFAQARLLALLDELGPSRVSALAAADHSSQPTTTTQLQRLEASGWVHRGADPDDARASLVSLSDEGRAALEDVRRARLAVLSPALDRLDGRALERVRIAIDVMDELLAAAAATPLTPSHPGKDG
nr:MarR family transcriptional regulator [Terrabacter sp. MAHUQ-38]